MPRINTNYTNSVTLNYLTAYLETSENFFHFGHADDISIQHLKNWVAVPGEFEVMIGSSSQDIKLREKFSLRE